MKFEARCRIRSTKLNLIYYGGFNVPFQQTERMTIYIPLDMEYMNFQMFEARCRTDLNHRNVAPKLIVKIYTFFNLNALKLPTVKLGSDCQNYIRGFWRSGGHLITVK